MASRRLILLSSKLVRNAHRITRYERLVNCTLCRLNSTEAIPEPHVEGQAKVFPPKLHSIVDDISKLTLAEVADLNELLKTTLKIQDAPVMAMGMPGMVAAPQEEEEEAVQKIEQTSFTVKLLEFQADKKITLIKEIKNLVEGMNLVQAKKFVEAAPQNVKEDISKDEAEKLKAAIEAVGGKCEIV